MMKWFVMMLTIGAFLWDIKAGIYTLICSGVWLLFYHYYKFILNMIIRAFKN